MHQSWRTWLKRVLIVAPPILFVVYIAHSFSVIGELQKGSTRFHMDYANDIVQEHLALAIEVDLERFKACVLKGETCDDLRWVSEKPYINGLLGEFRTPGGELRTAYLHRDALETSLTEFIDSQEGLNAMFSRRFELHDPVYWFRILDKSGSTVYQSGPIPQSHDAIASYAMERSLKGYQIEIEYNSFGARQLYSVSRKRVNFGLIFFLFLMVLFSAFLSTLSLRQKFQLAKQKTFFVSTVSHEFKTPLAIMRVAAETLEAKRFKTEAEEQKFLRMMVNEINRLDHLVQKTLNYSKIEMDQIHYHDQAIDLRDILKPSLEAFHTKAETEGIELKVDLSEQPCCIRGDASLIRHAIDNILDNAFKYRGDSILIEVSCRPNEDEVLLSIRDYGVGIAAEELPNITKSFYRIDDPKTRGIRGSGLGLAISTYILRHSKAMLDVTSQPKEGSTFTIRFPAQAAT